MKKQQGFTLIELMIVVAVIGVLSAIAIPQYQKYVAKAEVASALATMSGVKTNVEAVTVETGLFPAGGEENNIGAPTMDLGTILFVPTAETAAGAMKFTFNTSKSSSVSALVSGTEFSLTRDTNGLWGCAATGNKGVPVELLPKNCK